MRILILIFILFANAKADCPKMRYCQSSDEWKGYDQLAEVVCSDNQNNGQLHLGRVRDRWARVLVNSKILYYLTLDKTNKWIIVAKGPKFDIKDWERLGIPSGIR